MKKNQLNLFDELPQDNKSGLSQEYLELLDGLTQGHLNRKHLSPYVRDKMNADEYVHALTEHPEFSGENWGELENAKTLFKYSLHNTPENNDKVFETLKRKAAKNPDSGAADVLNIMLREANFSKNMLDEAAKGKDGAFGHRYSSGEAEDNISRALATNDNITEKEHKILSESNPKLLSGLFPKLSDSLKRKVINNPKTIEDIDHRDLRAFIGNDQLNQNPDSDSSLGSAEARAILNNAKARNSLYNQDEFDHVLGKLPEMERNAFATKHLGIEGGEQINTTAEGITPFGEAAREASPEEFQRLHNWQNWNNGEHYDKEIAQKLAASKHLSDEHAEHIKRHGDFDSKFALYNNPYIDPRHGVEMWRKWNNEDEQHGYDSEQLANKFQKTHPDVFGVEDLDENYWDDHESDILEYGDEYARENYDIDRWARDNNIKAWGHKDPSDHRDGEEWVRDHLYNNYDWEEENPNHDPELEALHQTILDKAPSQNGWIKEEDAVRVAQEEWDSHQPGGYTKTKRPTSLRDLQLPGPGADGDIHESDIEDHSQDHNPTHINYASHDDYTIDDHPDFDDRYNEAVEAWRDHMDSEHGLPDDFYDEHFDDYISDDRYNEYRREGEEEWKSEHFKNELKPELYKQSHRDDRFIPEHIKDHLPEYNQLKQDRVNKTGDGTNGPFLDKHIKDRSREHEYGEDQHFYEMVKDHANANKGTIDIGTMHKLYPNQKEKWKKIFENKGKLSVPEIDEKISTLPKTKYGISFGKWGGNQMQNINDRDQAIIRLDHSDESLAPIKENPEVFNTFKKVMDTSKRSGHPTKDNTIAWARVDMSDPKHWMVDELQSDFGKTVTQYLKDQGHHDKASHIETIANHHKNWREAMLNYITKEAKKHGVEKISTHSPESKALHTGAGTTHSVYNDSYGKVPRSMGFKPVSANELPLNERGLKKINSSVRINEQRYIDHEEAVKHHANMSLAHQKIADELGTNPNAETHRKIAQEHGNLFNKHSEFLKQMNPDHMYIDRSIEDIGSSDDADSNAEANIAVLRGSATPHHSDNLLNQPIKKDNTGGHTLNITPNLIKHLIDIADALIKAEILYINTLAKNEQSDKLLDKIKILRKYIGYEV